MNTKLVMVRNIECLLGKEVGIQHIIIVRIKIELKSNQDLVPHLQGIMVRAKT